VTPLQYLLIVSGILAVSLVCVAAVALLRAKRLAAVARAANLQFSRPDRFDLSRRVALRLGDRGVFGAAEVVVRDVMYATTPAGLLCVMTASFTLGTVGHRRQVRRVCAALDRPTRELEPFTLLPSDPSPATYILALAELRQKLAAPESTEPDAAGLRRVPLSPVQSDPKTTSA